MILRKILISTGLWRRMAIVGLVSSAAVTTGVVFHPRLANLGVAASPTPSLSQPASQTAEPTSARPLTSSPTRASETTSVAAADDSPTATTPAHTPTAPEETLAAIPTPDHSGPDTSGMHLNGWTTDYYEGFDRPFAETDWVPYGWGNPPVGSGAMGVRRQEDVFSRDGKLIVRTLYQDGQWSAGGASTEDIFTANRGRWEMRARMPQGKGIGYCFLLWPKNQVWPPEIDFAEGTVNGPQVMGTYHWDPDNKQEQRFFDNYDMQGWHTYGVIVEDDRIIFTFDGQEWGRIEHPGIADTPMFLAVQSGAMDPEGSAKDYFETVDGGVPGSLTPALTEIEVDWVAHYTPN